MPAETREPVPVALVGSAGLSAPAFFTRLEAAKTPSESAELDKAGELARAAASPTMFEGRGYISRTEKHVDIERV